ncbi:MAG: ATP-binding cassette domain-containing protein [Myxococcota bacterium]
MIRVQSVHKRFRRHVLKGVSLEIKKGEVFALIGPGASGKSVLFKSIAGLLPIDDGSIEVDRSEITQMDEFELAELRKRMGYLFQNYALFDFLTVGQNIAFPLRRLLNLSDNEVAHRVAERLERVNLSGFQDRDIRQLSGGQKKRVGFARATVTKPPIRLYDEPTAGLDPVTSQKIYDLILADQREVGATVVVISSDVAGVMTIADRVGMLLRGELIFEGTAEEAQRADDPRVLQFVHGHTEGPL